MTVIDLGERPQETRSCPECGKEFTGPSSGAGQVGMLVGTHRFREHGYRNPKKKTRSSTRPTDEDFAERPVVALVRDMGEAARGRGVPSAEQLTSAFGRGLGLTSIAVASWAVETDPNIPDGPPGEPLRDHLVDELSLTPKAAEDVMRPLAKAFSDTGLNRKYGRQIVENVDVVASIAELAKLSLNWRKYFRERSAATAAAGPPPIVNATSTMIPAPGPTLQSPPPQQGVVLGASEEVARANAAFLADQGAI